MLPDRTVEKMMRAAPELYPTRVHALAELFDSPDTYWRRGALVHFDPYAYVDQGLADIDEAELCRLYSRGKSASSEDSVQTILFVKRAKLERQFVYENASWLAKDCHSALLFDPDFKGRHFADLSKDISSEWMDAARELALAVLTSRYVDSQAASKSICRQFLEATNFHAAVTIYQSTRRSLPERVHQSSIACGLPYLNVL